MTSQKVIERKFQEVTSQTVLDHLKFHVITERGEAIETIGIVTRGLWERLDAAEKREHADIWYFVVVGTELEHYNDSLEGFAHYLNECFAVCPHWTNNS